MNENLLELKQENKNKILKNIKLAASTALIVLILVFAYLARGYFPFYNKNFVPLDGIKSIATETAGGGEVVFIEPELFGMIPHYEILVRLDYLIYKIDVAAKTGNILSFELED